MRKTYQLSAAVIVAALLLLTTVASLSADGPPPVIITTYQAGQVAPGFVFVDAFRQPFTATTPYAYILDSAGQPVTIEMFEAGDRSPDYKPLPEQGYQLTHGTTLSRSYVLKDPLTLSVTRVITAGGDYIIDTHDLDFDANGNALVMIYDGNEMDLTSYGGHPTATVQTLVLREIDPAGAVVWHWEARDHLDCISDTYIDLTTPLVDCDHANSAEYMADGNILVSNRHTSQIIKIDRQTGEVLWRLGGKASDFSHVGVDGPVPFSYQHDARELDNGHITLFNNDNLTGQTSGCMEFELDEGGMVATLVWSYTHPAGVFAPFTGSCRRLANGNTFIGWGAARLFGDVPNCTEVSPAGDIVFEMAFDGPYASYRCIKADWVGWRQYWPMVGND